VDGGNSVAERRNERQNWEFRSNVTRRVACPINLWISKTKSLLQKIARNRGNVALAPAPVINVRLIDQNEARRDSQGPDDHYQLRRAVGRALCAVRISE
jgi:hypothetical protein